MREFSRMVNRISQYSNYVLITGEIGTGKEKIARTLHYKSRRASHPFICVTCYPSRSTIESEIFVVEKGILPGVSKTKKSKL